MRTIFARTVADQETNFRMGLQSSIPPPATFREPTTISAPISKADKKDWDRFELPVTYGWNGGFYIYNNKFYRNPNFRSLLMVMYKNGQEQCAIGNVTQMQNLSIVPSDREYYNKCSHRWGGWDQNDVE